MNEIICADCLDILKSMPDKSVDLVLTDPPYGIANVWHGGSGCGWGRAAEQTPERNGWDVAPSQECFDHILRVGKTVCIWGGNYFQLPVSRGWLVWTKPERNFTLSEAELAWTSVDTVMRVFDGARSDSDRVHPTQKPLELMKWCLTKLSHEGDTVLDPFMGSGTVGIEAVRLHKHYLGCELNPDYIKMANRRIQDMIGPLFVKDELFP